MRVALVLALAAVALREPDAPVGDTVDGADVDAVRANHFHVPGDLVRSHLGSPLVSPIALELDVLRQAEPANCQRVCAGRNCGSSRGGVPAASRESSLASPLAVSGRQNLTTLSRCEQLYRNGGDPWQTIDRSGGVPPRQLPMRADEVAG